MKRYFLFLLVICCLGLVSPVSSQSQGQLIFRWRTSIINAIKLAQVPEPIALETPFAKAEINVDSIFNERWYVQVAEDANVYTSPDLSAPIKYLSLIHI